jgi:RNA polymerase sigma-70 factor (ECF subfamily)
MMSALMEQRSTAMQRATQGDADSFAIVLDPLLNPAYRLAAVMLSDRMAAEDAVQEAAVKAWRNLGQLRGDETSLRAWFLSIVANECRMARRRRWWSVVKLAEVESERESGGLTQEASTDLRRAISKLSLDERLPLVLYFYLDLPLDEVARTLRVSPAAAKSRIYRAARRLRSDLTFEEVT